MDLNEFADLLSGKASKPAGVDDALMQVIQRSVTEAIRGYQQGPPPSAGVSAAGQTGRPPRPAQGHPFAVSEDAGFEEALAMRLAAPGGDVQPSAVDAPPPMIAQAPAAAPHPTVDEQFCDLG